MHVETQSFLRDAYARAALKLRRFGRRVRWFFQDLCARFRRCVSVDNIGLDLQDIKFAQTLLAIDVEILRELIMATKQEVLDAVAAEAAEVAARVNELLAEIQALKDQIAAGGAVTAADLDELKAAVEGIFNAPVVPPVEPPVVP